MFEGFPKNIQESAIRWGDCVNSYAANVTPVSTTSEAAKLSFISAMQSVNVNAGNGLILFNNALVSYALTLAGGMVGGGFIGTPPPVPPTIQVIAPIGLGGGTSEAIANMLASIIDIWFKTGTATPSSGGSPILWT